MSQIIFANSKVSGFDIFFVLIPHRFIIFTYAEEAHWYRGACFEIAKRSRGTPRIANSLLRRVRDFAQVEGEGNIDIQITKSSLKALNVDKNGLDEMDNKILLTIIDKYNGGPVGISTLSTSLSENVETIEEVYEPFLIQQGFIIRTP